MQIFSGTSGYSYKEWCGSFYPEKTAQEDMLGLYAAELSAVEINNTFYRMPKSHVVEGWRDAVPDHFRFTFKASRRITHQKRLKDAEEPVSFLIRAAERLENKLGAVLFQLPPYLRKDIERLDSFLDLWPEHLPAVVEFRHESWLDEETYDVLQKHNVGLVVSEDGELPLPEPVAVGPLAYLRLRKPRYTQPTLSKWLRRCEEADVQQLFAFFKHEDAGAGPKLAAKFAQLAERPKPQRAPRKPAKGKRKAS